MKGFFFLFFFFFFPFSINANDFDIGKKLFLSHCAVCHLNGTNIIIPEKNLKKETLEMNGMNNLDAIIYQIINGKNGMPAFGGRLSEKQIRDISNYVLHQSITDFTQEI